MRTKRAENFGKWGGTMSLMGGTQDFLDGQASIGGGQGSDGGGPPSPSMLDNPAHPSNWGSQKGVDAIR